MISRPEITKDTAFDGRKPQMSTRIANTIISTLKYSLGSNSGLFKSEF